MRRTRLAWTRGRALSSRSRATTSDRPDRGGASGAGSAAGQPLGRDTYVLVPAQQDGAKWAVPLGVRTASEWAWRGIAIGIALVAILYLLAFLSEVVIPVLVALLLAALLEPVKRILSRWMPSGMATGLTVVGTLAATVTLISFVASQFVGQFGNIRTQVGEGYDQIRDWIRTTLHISDTQVDSWIDTLRQQLTASSGNLGQAAASAGITVTHVIAGFFIAMFTLFFFLHDGAGIWAWVVRLFPRTARVKVHSSGLVAWGQLSAFTRATMLVAAVDATGIGLTAGILGVPFASGVAVIVFFGAFVPVIGAFISGAVPVLLALVALGPFKALLMLGGVVLVQQLESHVLQPFILGRSVRVHPLSVILAIATGVLLAGIIGALIAVPVVAVLNAVGHHLLDEVPQPADNDVAPSADSVEGTGAPPGALPEAAGERSNDEDPPGRHVDAVIETAVPLLDAVAPGPSADPDPSRTPGTLD